MKYKEIKSIVKKIGITTVNQRIEVKFKNKNSIFGYFPGIQINDEVSNKWNFIVLPQNINPKNIIIVNGNDIVDIILHTKEF